MDVHAFLFEIRNRECLWNPENPLYKRRGLVDQNWDEIADMFNISVKAAKHKWKNLRDTFRCEIKRQKKRRISNPNTESSWAYFDDLDFIKDIFRTKKGDVLDIDDNFSDWDSNTIDVTDINDHIEHKEFTIVPIETLTPYSNTFQEEVPESSTSLLVAKRGRPKKTAVKKIKIKKTPSPERFQFPQTSEINVLAGIGDKCEDEDMFFLKSLLPMMKKLSDQSKLSFRIKVEQLLQNELFGDECLK